MNVIKRIYSYLKSYKISLIFVAIFAIISAIFTVIAPYILGRITTILYETSATNFDFNQIKILLIYLVLIHITSQIFAFSQNFLMTKITSKAIQKLRGDINKKVHKIELNYYDTKSNGDILSVVTNDVETISSTISQNLTQIISSLVTTIGVLIMMIRINITLSLVSIITIPISFMVTKNIVKSNQKHYFRQQNILGQINGFIEESYNCHPVIQSFNYQNKSKIDFENLNHKLKESSQKAEIGSGIIRPITMLINNFVYAINATWGCFLVLNGRMSIGNVQAILQYSRQFGHPFSNIAAMAGSFSAALAASKRIFEFIDLEDEIDNQNNEIICDEKWGDVEFKNVNFGYCRDKILMNNVNIKIKSGQKVAIVGPTGAGKTTLVNLLMRFYEVSSGDITINNIDIKKISKNQLRSHFGIVLQETWLFEGSIRDNIAYSKDFMDIEEVILASKAACSDEFIKTLPGSYDMILTKGAENISQGERQLLTIARAIASKPDIMILDEATSNVDTHTERIIQKAMGALMKDKTSFVIAHRLSTIKDADVILYMEDGDIKEFGDHKTLMNFEGKYADLYNSQFS